MAAKIIDLAKARARLRVPVKPSGLSPGSGGEFAQFLGIDVGTDDRTVVAIWDGDNFTLLDADRQAKALGQFFGVEPGEK